MTLTMDLLEQIERESSSAPASLLRMRLDQLRAGRALASDDARDYASVLLLKLEHRLRTECVGPVSQPDTPTYLAPRIGVGEPGPRPRGRRKPSLVTPRLAGKARREVMSV